MSIQIKSTAGRAAKSAEDLFVFVFLRDKRLSPQTRTAKKRRRIFSRDAASSGAEKTHSGADSPAMDKGSCRSLCPRGTRPTDRATRPAASPALLSSPAPPVSRHQPLPVQGRLRPPARRRHFQLFPGRKRTTHKTNKRPAAPAPASLPQPPTRAAPRRPAPAHGHAPTPAGPASLGTGASAHCSPRPEQSNGKRGSYGRNGKGRGRQRRRAGGGLRAARVSPPTRSGRKRALVSGRTFESHRSGASRWSRSGDLVWSRRKATGERPAPVSPGLAPDTDPVESTSRGRSVRLRLPSSSGEGPLGPRGHCRGMRRGGRAPRSAPA